MIPLQQITVASPCHESWDEMSGNAKQRHCQSCRKDVYNLSEMTTADAEALLKRTDAQVCVRFYRRADGTVMTQDCPVGLRAVRRRVAAAVSWAVAAIVGAIFSPFMTRAGQGAPTMGEPMAKPTATVGHPTPSTRETIMGVPPPPPPQVETGRVAHPPKQIEMGDVAIAPPKPPAHPTIGQAVLNPPIMGKIAMPPTKPHKHGAKSHTH